MTGAATRPLLIGLIGRAGAGKSTVSAFLEHAFAFEQVAFADPIFAMVMALFQDCDVTENWAMERVLKEKPVPVLGLSYRRLAQTLGTEWGRQVLGDDLWVRIAAHKVRQALQLDLSVVISDVRFPNEAAWITGMGGVLVRVQRPDVERVHPHESESHIVTLPHHHTLINDGSFVTLEDQVDRLVGELRQARAKPVPPSEVSA